MNGCKICGDNGHCYCCNNEYLQERELAWFSFADTKCWASDEIKCTAKIGFIACYDMRRDAITNKDIQIKSLRCDLRYYKSGVEHLSKNSESLDHNMNNLIEAYEFSYAMITKWAKIHDDKKHQGCVVRCNNFWDGFKHIKTALACRGNFNE